MIKKTAFLFLTASLVGFPALAELVPASDDFRVTAPSSEIQALPSVSFQAGGSFLIAWQGSKPTAGSDIQGRLFNNAGDAEAPEFGVNSGFKGVQGRPSLATDATGNTLSVWHSSTSTGTDQSGYSIQGRLFSPDGTPLGTDFQINSHTPDWQINPRVAALAGGGWVVVWRSNTSDGTDNSQASIQARLIAADGTLLGSDFQVNTYTSRNQQLPAVAATPDGGFVVVWQSLIQDGWGDGIYGQRFDANADPVGPEFRVNSQTLGFQTRAAVAAGAADGSFVVVWQSEEGTSTQTDVRGQLFTSNGSHFGNEFLVNSFTTSSQQSPAVAMAADGSFIVAWHSYGSVGTDTDGFSVQARSFDANGTPQISDFQVNTTVAGNQQDAALDLDANGNLVVVWETQDASGDSDLFLRRFVDSSGFTR